MSALMHEALEIGQFVTRGGDPVAIILRTKPFYNGRARAVTVRTELGEELVIKVWDADVPESGPASFLDCSVKEWAGSTELQAQGARALSEEEAAEYPWIDQFLPFSRARQEDQEADIEEASSIVRETVAMFEDGRDFPGVDFTKVAHVLITEWEELQRANRTAPAARGHHHAFPGGLAFHTLSMLKLSKTLSAFYADRYGNKVRELDMSVVTLAILCHDSLKPLEYKPTEGWQYGQEFSPFGKEIGHLVGSAMGVVQVLSRLGADVVEDARARNLVHCILAHHGKLEWGSPVTPQTPEAQFVHHLDYMDSQFDKFMRT